MKKQKLKRNKGITLIALVVTIIVLLILAGVSIAMLTGEGGILTNAREARDKTNIQDIIEQARMDILAKQLEKTGKNITEKELKAILEKYGELSGEEGKSILEQTLKTDKGDITVSDIYNGEVAGGITAESIFDKKTNYYGKYVDYPIDINGDGKTEKDWKIFYVKDYTGEKDGSEYYNNQQENKPQNGKRIFLIASDYVGHNCTALSSAVEECKMNSEKGNKDCCYTWRDTTYETLQLMTYEYHCTVPKNANSSKRACEFPSLFEFSSYDIEANKTDKNSKYASALLCTENWKSFVNVKYADFAIGGATAVMWCSSWNGYYNSLSGSETQDLFQRINAGANDLHGGYGISNGNPSIRCEAWCVSGNKTFTSVEEAKKAVNTMYFPHPGVYENDFDLDNDGEPDYCGGYWLASPAASAASTYRDSSIAGIYSGGTVNGYGPSNSYGIRPVICLKSDVHLQMQRNADGDSYYKLVDSDE